MSMDPKERVNYAHSRCGGINEFLGEDICSQDALQVQFLPLRPFYKGVIVAWRFQNGEKLKYGKVLEDVKPSAGQAKAFDEKHRSASCWYKTREKWNTTLSNLTAKDPAIVT